MSEDHIVEANKKVGTESERSSLDGLARRLCTTPLCGRRAVWMVPDYGDNMIAKCDVCHTRNGWERRTCVRIEEPPSVRVSDSAGETK